MTDRRAARPVRSPSSRLDRVRAWLGIGAALALGAFVATGLGGVWLGTIALVVTILQRLNLVVFRRNSASRKDGRARYSRGVGAAESGSVSQRSEHAPLLFRVEELAALATSLGALLLLGHGLNMPIHPLLYVAVAVLFVIGLLFQLFPQLRPRPPGAPRRNIVRPPSEWLN